MIAAEAQRLAELGYAVVPAKGKAPCTSKNGCIAGKAGVVPRLAPGDNLAIVAGRGATRLVIVDVDDLDHPFYAWLCATYPSAPRVMTGSGCGHLYFRDPDPKSSSEAVRGRDGEIYSLRRGNAVAICPPSIHPDTQLPYQWLVQLGSPDLLPVWEGEAVSRHHLYRLCAQVSALREGARQDGLWRAAVAAWRLRLPEDVVERALRAAAADCGLSGEQDVDRQIARAKALADDDVLAESATDLGLARALVVHLGRVCTVGGETWIYRPATGAWAVEAPDLLRARVYTLEGHTALDGTAITVSYARADSVRRVVGDVTACSALPGDGRALAWADHTVRWTPGLGLAVTAHDADLGATDVLPWPWHGPTDAPTYDAAASTWVRTDAERELLLEWLGVCLLGWSTRLGRALRLHGPRGSGKSTWLELATRLVPRAVAVRPSDVGQRFGAAELDEHTRLCYVDELGRDVTMSEDAWKTAVHGHALGIERKYVDPRTVRPIAGWLAAGNTWPRCPGIHDSFFQRWLVVSFPESLRDTSGEIQGLAAALWLEAPAIARRAVALGAAALDRGGYARTPRSDELLVEWQESSDPVLEWLQERTRPSKVAASASVLHQDYAAWAKLGGYAVTSRAEWLRRLAGKVELGRTACHHRGLCLEVVE